MGRRVQPCVHYRERKIIIILQCEFTPPAWINDYAVAVDPHGDTVFNVSCPDGVPIPKDCTFASDVLGLSVDAPQWIQDWEGPSETQVLNREKFEKV